MSPLRCHEFFSCCREGEPTAITRHRLSAKTLLNVSDASEPVRRRTQLRTYSDIHPPPYAVPVLSPLSPPRLTLDVFLNRIHIHRLSHEVHQLQTTLRVLRTPARVSEQRESGLTQIHPGKNKFHVANNGIENLAEVSVAFLHMYVHVTISKKFLHNRRPLFFRRRTTKRAVNNSNALLRPKNRQQSRRRTAVTLPILPRPSRTAFKQRSMHTSSCSPSVPRFPPSNVTPPLWRQTSIISRTPRPQPLTKQR